MDRTFNNGLGMVAVAAADKADAIVKTSQGAQAAALSSSVSSVKGARGVTFV